MAKLHFATETEPEAEELEADGINCSRSSVIHGIERYAAYQPAGAARQWADLLEGIRQLREKN